ncbi:conserved membrane hypothetical protein [Hyphomicrobiales bacterium]|jgi:hypothetical protein|nr:conserved membrane hypothetical protein [Hyphomicrobiales bacterium]CAH1702900.1 membrane hypothetical protein [Hyphomicrobiales bacterium]CAI0347087.1 conserved membrane hypothetical protein [Hyphomicrobiales bacterium]
MTAITDIQPAEDKRVRRMKRTDLMWILCFFVPVLALVVYGFWYVWGEYGLLPWNYSVYYEALPAKRVVEMMAAPYESLDKEFIGRLMGSTVWAIAIPALSLLAVMALWAWESRYGKPLRDHLMLLILMVGVLSSIPMFHTQMAVSEEQATMKAIRVTSDQIRDALKAAGIDASGVAHPLLATSRP